MHLISSAGPSFNFMGIRGDLMATNFAQSFIKSHVMGLEGEIQILW